MDPELRKVREVEYRDSEGNILSEEQVKVLQEQGEISFETRYETRTRLIDTEGRELPKEAIIAPEQVLIAPEHPDVQGANPETVAKEEPKAPANKPAEVKGENESPKKKENKPKPASEAKAATN